MKAAFFALIVTCAFAVIVSCGGGGKGSGSGSGSSKNGNNVLPISVNRGPAGNYANGVFASVNVCVPGSSQCQTITGVLVDTGSVGLRILSSALTLPLPQQKGPSGNSVVECLPFVTSFTWGPVQTADVHLAGETAGNVPIQVLSDTDFPVASGCKNFGTPSADTLQSLGANGILGVGFFLQDCGGGCAQTGSSNPGLYYECSSSGCRVIAESLNNQVQNPVALFANDNNGVLIQLPAVSGTPQASLNGSLIFGISTQSNNSLGSSTVYAPNSSGDLTTQFQGHSYPNSFIDSGSNGLFFLDSKATGLPLCSDSNSFYCPSSVQNLSATNVGANGTGGPVNFSVASADMLFSTSGASVFSELAGPNSGSFDWGLPFFYGRNVFTAIETRPTPQGVGPFWAY